MKTLATRALATLLAVTITASAAPTARAAVPTAPPDASPLGLIPPRLSYLDGEVSFWRPGAQDWSPAEVNIPLAPEIGRASCRERVEIPGGAVSRTKKSRHHQ